VDDGDAWIWGEVMNIIPFIIFLCYPFSEFKRESTLSLTEKGGFPFQKAHFLQRKQGKGAEEKADFLFPPRFSTLPLSLLYNTQVTDEEESLNRSLRDNHKRKTGFRRCLGRQQETNLHPAPPPPPPLHSTQTQNF